MQPVQYPFPANRGGYPPMQVAAYPPPGMRGQTVPHPFAMQAPAPALNPAVYPAYPVVYPAVYQGPAHAQISPQSPFGVIPPPMRGGLGSPLPPLFGRGQPQLQGGFTADQVARINSQMAQSVTAPLPNAAPRSPHDLPVQREIPRRD